MKFKKYIGLSIIFFLLFISNAVSQDSSISGLVIDKVSGEALIGVHILFEDNGGTATNENGNFKISIAPGTYSITIKYIGYIDKIIDISVAPNEKKELVIELKQGNALLDDVVVTAGRFEQKLGDVVTSMEVIKPDFIESINAESMDVALNKVPGLNIADGQASIRGGGGYSYGAGSRVLLLVDDLPLLSPDAGDIKWNFIPLENIEQVEIIKGASSALYGSSALNGVINVRTANPGIAPQTKINMYTGLYLNPAREELKWWGDKQLFYTGTSIFHSRIVGNTDLILGANIFNDQGYRADNHEDRIRYNMSVTHRSKKVKGLSYGISTNIMYHDKTDFILWKNSKEGAYIQFEDAISPSTGIRLNIDPFISYFNEKGEKHSLKSRYFKTSNSIDGDNMDSDGELFFTEYRYSRKYKRDFHVTGGVSYTGSSVIAQLYGDHTSSNQAIFVQADKNFFKRISTSFGVRWEGYRLDNITESSRPLMRVGINYQMAEFTYFRSSFGQGYRFPTIAEKFTKTQLGGLQILPSPNLMSESGWSYESGIKQGFRISNWSGFVDLSVFWTEYENMMEFTFGVYDSITYEPIYDMSQYGGNPVGFQSRNVGLAQIKGVELVLTGKGMIGSLPVSLLAGYTYTHPIDLNTDSIYQLTKSNTDNILKYRFFHSATANAQVDYRKLSFGVSWKYTSHVENIDAFFEYGIVLPGLKEYREEHNNGYHLIDLRLTYQPGNNHHFSLILKNASNNEIMVRPGDILAPRTIVFQYGVNF